MTGKGTVSLEPFAPPPLGADQVLLEADFTAISPGTELAWLHHRPGTPGSYPYVPGYSGCGRVVGRGAAVDSLEVGQAVACSMPHASHHVVEARRCHPLPDGLDPAHTSPFRLASIALQGVRRANVQLGSRVAVIGLGPIGLLAAQLATASGAAHVEGIDPLEWRRRLALECCLDAVSASAANPASSDFDVVIEATGAPAAIPAAFRLAAKRGTVILLGSTRGLTDGVDFYRDVHKKGLHIIGAHEETRAPCDEATETTHLRDEAVVLALAAGARIRLDPLVSEVVPANDAPMAYRRLNEPSEMLMLLVLGWG